jgi:hypothetical protein
MVVQPFKLVKGLALTSGSLASKTSKEHNSKRVNTIPKPVLLLNLLHSVDKMLRTALKVYATTFVADS